MTSAVEGSLKEDVMVLGMVVMAVADEMVEEEEVRRSFWENSEMVLSGKVSMIAAVEERRVEGVRW